jgi:hypothetical protein
MALVRIRLFLLAALASTVLAAGCGNAGSSGSGSTAAQDAVPADALFYADVNLDRGSDAWKQFAAVGQRFPGWQRLVDQIANGFTSGGSSTTNVALDSGPTTTFKGDIEPWLGGSAAVAVTSVDASAGTAGWLVFVASTDDSKAKAALLKDGGTADGSYAGYSLYRSSDGTSEAAVGDGAVLLGTDTGTLHDSIDVRDGKADSLSSNDAFTSAMSKLPSESLVRGYVNTQKLSQLVGFAALGGIGSASSSSAQVQKLASSLNALDSLTFAAWASQDGYHLSLRTTLKPGADGSLFTRQAQPSTLSPLVPGDAFAFLAFANYGDYLKQALDGGAPGMALRLQRFEQQTGLSVNNDLIPLLSGQELLYAAPGVPVRAALLLKPDDPQAAAATMHKIAALLVKSVPGATLTPLASGEGEQISLSNGLAVTWRLTANGLIAVGNDQAAGDAPSSSLLSSAAYKDLLSQAGVPSGAAVPLYVNLPGLLKLLPLSADPNLQHIGSVLAWSSHDGNDYSSDLFVQVK